MSKLSPIIYTSTDDGHNWDMRRADANCILVIVPGSGTHRNRSVYDELVKHGYQLIFMGTSGYEYDKYPAHWDNNQSLRSTGGGRDLASLASLYTEAVGNRIPAMIICGSRGAQVTIGLVWRNFWRGPTIVINAGSLTTSTQIPMGVFPVMVTMGNDDFHTSKESYVHQNFKDLSEVPGMLFHLPLDAHMPMRLHHYIYNLVNLTIRREARPETWWRAFPTSMASGEAFYIVGLEPGKRGFAVVQNANKYKQTILRASSTSGSDWLWSGSARVVVNDGDVVVVTGMGHEGDNNHRHMYTVRRVGGNSLGAEGWIFSWNIVPKGKGQ